MTTSAPAGSPPSATAAPSVPPLGLVIAAFAAVYLIWGSTYLAIGIAVKSMPPFLMAGTRFTLAGVLLYLLTSRQPGPRSDPQHWRSALIVGGLLLCGGNGLVSWAEQSVPTGLAALIIASVPLWMVIIPVPGQRRPTAAVLVGVLLGLVGIAVLVGPSNLGGVRPDRLGVAALLMAAFLWALGSLLSRRLPQSAIPLRATAMQMIAGGLLQIGVGLLLREGPRFHPTAISVDAWLAWGYLVFFGSLLGFTAYTWLLRVSTPARVSTYAYVNPFVAVLLGWLILGEPLSPRVLGAGALILAAVAFLSRRQR